MSYHQDGQIHISWAPGSENLSHEEREKIAADLLARGKRRNEEHEKAVKALEGLPYVAVPIEQMVEIYEKMLRLVKLGQTSGDELGTLPEPLRKLRLAVFREADFGAVFAGQWLPKDIRSETRDRVHAEMRAALVAKTDTELTQKAEKTNATK